MFSNFYMNEMPVPVAARSKASVCGRSPAEIVGFPPGEWMFVCCECCVRRADHSSRGSYRLWCVVVCDLETSGMRRPWPTLGRSATGKKKNKKYMCVCVCVCVFAETSKIQFREPQVEYNWYMLRDNKIVSGFSQTQQYIFIFILTTCFGQLFVIRPSLLNLE